MSTSFEETVRKLAATGRAAWPMLEAHEGAFVRSLQRHLAAAPDGVAWLARVRADDLYLACACAEGDVAAIRVFEQRFAAVIDSAVARFSRSGERDELVQLLRERLFVAPPGGAPRIATYTGQGFLENWVRVAALRAFVNAQRGERVGDPDEESLCDLPDGRDVELHYLKARYRAAFQQAFERAIETLTVAERLVLRLSVLSRLSSDELAKSLGVHRATAARRAARARQALMDATLRELGRALKIDDAELTSILHLIESDLDVSLSRLLKEPVEAAGGPAPSRWGFERPLDAPTPDD